MLRKILVKVTVTNKFTQCKTSRTLKVDVFEITDNKNIGKLFSKYELLLLDQANSSSDPSQALTKRFHTPRASHNLHYIFHWFPYFVLPHSTKRHHKYWIYQTYDKPSQSNLLSSCLQIIIPNGSGTLPIKMLSL